MYCSYITEKLFNQTEIIFFIHNEKKKKGCVKNVQKNIGAWSILTNLMVVIL